MAKNYNRSIWIAFCLVAVVTWLGGWAVSGLVHDAQNSSEIASLKSEKDAVNKRLDTISTTRDNYRENSLQCSIAYQDMKGVVQTFGSGLKVAQGNDKALDQWLITWGKSGTEYAKRIKHYDDVCKVVPETGK